MKTAKQIQRQFETKQAKDWGYKSVKDANDDGYNVTRNSVSVRDLMHLLKITEQEAYRMVNEWKSTDQIQFCQYANLEKITFL